MLRTEHRIEENKKIGLIIVKDKVITNLGITLLGFDAGIDAVTQWRLLVFLPQLDIVLYIIFAVNAIILVHPFHLIVLVQKRQEKTAPMKGLLPIVLYRYFNSEIYSIFKICLQR